MSRNTIAVSILAAIILLLAFFQTPLMRQARRVAWDSTTRGVARMFGLRDAATPVEITDQLQAAKAENIRLQAQLADYRRLKAELNTPAVEQLRAVPAAVLSRPVDTLQAELVITKGLADGVAIGDPVVTLNSLLVGFVVEANQHSAIVRTLYHPATRVTAEVMDTDDNTPPIRGLLESRFYSALFVSTIPRDTIVQPDQAVVTVTDESGVPSGLVIGKVVSVESKEHDAYQEARLMSEYDIDAIDAVTILTQP